MSDPVVLAVVAVIAIAAGIGIGFVARSVMASQSIKAAQEKAGRIVAEARTQQKDLILQAKDEQVRLAREAEEDARSRRGELGTLEKRLLQRDEQLDQRTDMLEERDRKLIAREREIDQAKEELPARAPSRSRRSSASRRCHRIRPRACCSRRSARTPSTTPSGWRARSSARPRKRPRTRRATWSSRQSSGSWSTTRQR